MAPQVGSVPGDINLRLWILALKLQSLMAPLVIPGVNVPLLTGPMVLGFMWSFGLYGVLVVQVYIYSQLSPKDRIEIKWLVWVLFFLESVFMFFQMIAAWLLFGSGWGDVDRLFAFNWSWVPLVLLNGLLAGIAQGFYTWRIWQLMNRVIWLPLLIICIIILQMAATFYFGIRIQVMGDSYEAVYSVSREITLWLSADLVADNLITISLVTILSRRKSKTLFSQTAGMINRLIRFSIESGAVTSIGAIMELTLWLTCNEWNFHFILFLILGRLYSNVLMATLNARAPLLQAGGTDVGSGGGPLHIQTSFWNDGGNSPKLAGLKFAHKSKSTGAGGTTVDNNTDVIVMTHFESTAEDIGHKKGGNEVHAL
ncbi:hypothetical protein C8F04DRAFT_1078533 [Mycena alexandri]|uniref:DUF6534 domain-containing protein n=1 Tax=Mycena alexandri TaxID=1745969 RepID=A0AAD6TA88_9AGAR|nr:hypothetical protein C8F04DRAFT_1078533 [Mycena alexandri]